MKIQSPRNGPEIPLPTIIRIIETHSTISYNGNVIVADYPAQLTPRAVRIRLRTRSSTGPGSRRSWSGRRGPVACWHAYRDVIRAILINYPEATVRTRMAAYKGLSGFDQLYPRTARVNIGSMIAPVTMPELCECGNNEPPFPPPPQPRRQRKPTPPPPAPDILARIDETLGHIYEDSTGEIFYVPKGG